MNSKNFKKVLSTSIASLTVLSTLGGSVSTKIYANGGEGTGTTQSSDPQADTKEIIIPEDGQLDFIFNEKVYKLTFYKEDYKTACDELKLNGSYESFLKRLVIAKAIINGEKNVDDYNNEQTHFAESPENFKGLVKFISGEHANKEYAEATGKYLEIGIKAADNSANENEDASGATEEVKKEEARKEEVKKELQATDVELVEGDKKTEPAEEVTTPAAEDTQKAPAELQQTAETVTTEQTTDESQKPKATEEVTTPAAENTQKAPAVPQQPAEGKTPAINVSDKSKGSIFKRAFNAIKGFFSNIFNFVRGLFHKVK